MKRVVTLFSVAASVLAMSACASQGDEGDRSDESGQVAGGGGIFDDDSSAVPVRILASSHAGHAALQRDTVIDIVVDELTLDSPDTRVGRVMVRVTYDDVGAPAHLIVYVESSVDYRLTVSKIVLGDDYQVLGIVPDYVETAADVAQVPLEKADPTCPDDTIDFVFASMHTEISSAVSGIETATEDISALGYNVESILGNGATVGAYKAWLACDNLIGFGQIGHGYPNGISLADGLLSASYFESLPADALAGTIVYFNSCDVHVPPMEPAIIGAGASRYIGGDISIAIGPSEEVFKCTWRDGVTTKTALEPILLDCEEEHYEPGAEGISGDGPLPWNATGADCTSNDTCDSGFCVAGVCCNTACEGGCQTCAAAGSVGTCTPLAEGSSCGDGDACNGEEVCQAGTCAAGAPLSCDDGNQCTADACDPVGGCGSANDDGAQCGGCGVCSGGACTDDGCGGGPGADDGTVVTGGCAVTVPGREGLGGLGFAALVLGLLVASMRRRRTRR